MMPSGGEPLHLLQQALAEVCKGAQKVRQSVGSSQGSPALGLPGNARQPNPHHCRGTGAPSTERGLPSTLQAAGTCTETRVHLPRWRCGGPAARPAALKLSRRSAVTDHGHPGMDGQGAQDAPGTPLFSEGTEPCALCGGCGCCCSVCTGACAAFRVRHLPTCATDGRLDTRQHALRCTAQVDAAAFMTDRDLGTRLVLSPADVTTEAVRAGAWRCRRHVHHAPAPPACRRKRPHSLLP